MGPATATHPEANADQALHDVVATICRRGDVSIRVKFSPRQGVMLTFGDFSPRDWPDGP